MNHGRTHFMLAVAMMMAFLSACAPWSTYPPVETKAATQLTRPTFEPVPTVMAEGVRYARERYLKGQDVAINLPQGASYKVYDSVFEKLGGGRAMITPDEPAIHVTQVRTRGFDAQVDLVYPRSDGLNQSVTLTLRREVFSDWKVKSDKAWQMGDVETPAPNYVPPPPEPAPKSKEQGT